MTQPELMSDAAEDVAAAEAIAPTTMRERGHIAAAKALVAGDYDDAADKFERILINHPHDMQALQMAHLMDFYRGDAVNLKDRVARRRPYWSASDPDFGFVLGMHAFRAGRMQPVCGGRRHRARRPGASGRGLLGDPCRNPRDGDAGPPRRGHSVPDRQRSQLGTRRQRFRLSQLVAPLAVSPWSRRTSTRFGGSTTGRSIRPKPTSPWNWLMPLPSCGACT